MDNITIKTTRDKQLNFRQSLYPNGRLHEPPISESLEMGLAELKACYKTGKCSFDNLYERKLAQQYDSSLTYTFAAVYCKYLIDNYGQEYFYNLYYNKEITSNNFIKKVSEITGKSQDKMKKGVEEIILQ